VPAEEGEYFLKVLIPSYAAGSIIGKGGQTIVQLQKETGATIKLSKSKDFYPGELPSSFPPSFPCIRVSDEEEGAALRGTESSGGPPLPLRRQSCPSPRGLA
jgi:hypothetical protein